MNKILAIVFLLLILIVGYFLETYIDYSSSYFGLLKFTMIGIAVFYSYKLIPMSMALSFAENKWGINRKQGVGFAFLSWLFTAIAILIFVEIGSERVNNFLLEKKNEITIATIGNCYTSSVQEYCIYSYFINGYYYEHKFKNQRHKFKNGDTIQIKYYVNNPIISKIADLEKSNE
jgi:hypothetical protein